MHAATKLYIIVNTVTDYRNTLRAMREGFDATLVWEGLTNAKSFVHEHVDFFRKLVADGTVSLVENENGNWQARQFIYRLALKPCPPA